MRPSRLFLSWALLASTAAALSTPARWRFEARDGLMKRQDPATTDAAPTELPTTTDAASTPAPTDAQLTTSEVATSLVSDPAATPTSDPAATPTSSPVETSQPPTSDPVQTGSSTSVGLLFTQTQQTTRPVVTVTVSPSADHNDSDVAFFDSKYHQLIIALGSISAALLIALIATAVIAFRARADNDLLHDQLSRHEEGISLQQRGKAGSIGSAGGYGRLSLNDPDDMRHSRRSMSESQLKPMDKRRLSGAPMGSGTPPGNRRVAFGSDTTHSQSDHSTAKGDSPFSDSQHQMNRTTSSDSAIRRLPTAPGTSSGSHEGYTDPFAGGTAR